MPSDTRRDVATATTGAVGLAAGGGMRHAAVSGMKKKPKVHMIGVLRNGTKGQRRLFLAGSTLGLLSTAPLGVGTTRLATGGVDKRLPAQQKCKYGDEPATHRILHSEGMAYIPVCSAHMSKGKRHAEGCVPSGRPHPSQSNIVSVKPIAKALKVTGVRAVGGEWGSRQPNQNDLERALTLARRLRTSSGRRRTTSLSEVLSGTRGNLAKRDGEHRGFWREGLSGSADAIKLKGQSATQPVPKEIRGMQLGVAAGAGLGGSALTRALLPKGARPFAGPVAGGLAATASVPGTNKLVQRKHPEYKVSAYGVTRRKTAPKRPSSKANIVSSRLGPTRGQIVPNDERFAKRATPPVPLRVRRPRKLDVNLPKPVEPNYIIEYRRKRPVAKLDSQSYLGARTSYPTQRAAVTLAGHPPVVGPITSAATAGRYAPPGQERKHALRQWGMGSGAGAAAGVGGAFGGAHLAERSDRALRVAQGTLNAKDKVEAKARSAVGMGAKKPMNPASFRGRQLARAISSKPGRALLGANPEKMGVRAAGAAAGFLATKTLVSTAGGQAAISLNQRDQTAYNRKRGIHKGAPAPTKREQHKLAERKRANAALSVVGGTAGLAGLGLLAAGKHRPAAAATTIGGGVGGLNALLNARVQRQEAKAVDPFAKAGTPKKVLRFVGSEGVGRARAQYPERSPALADLHLPETDPVIWHGRYAARHDQALKIKRLNRKRTGTNTRRAFDNLGLPRDLARHRGPVEGQFGKSVMTGLQSRLLTTAAPKVHLVKPGTAGFGRAQARQQLRRVVNGGTTRLALDPTRALRPLEDLAKREPTRPPLKTSISEDDARKLVDRHGLKGPLPKELNREQRRAAYEARYVSAGGHKAEKWQHRAVVGDKVKTAGLAGATAAGVPWLAARTRAGHAVGRTLQRAVPRLRRVSSHQVAHHAETAAGTAAIVGGGGELYAAHSRRKRSSYASAPAGVAASALRRMQDYDPETP